MDFFTPIVDDPYTFGQIAVANALSDVYAMGGKPLIAMNIVCFPINKLDVSILEDILRGGLDKMREAQVLLVGGHSVEDDEPKYGLSVTGTLHPERIWFNSALRSGDMLVLTKPLGTGIINTAVKGEMADEVSVKKSIECMVALNREAAEIASPFDVHACTDVTGFGFLGHACEMVEGSNVGLLIHSASVPYITEAKKYAEMGLLPAGLHRNRQFRIPLIEDASGIPQWLMDIFFDPQTSGGLLLSLPALQAEELVKILREESQNGRDASIIGEVIEKPAGRILVR
jgi:selenide,water dikinase